MVQISNTAFHLKGSMMTLTVMHLINPDPEAINKQLGRVISESPNLFRNMPVVIDLTRLKDHPPTIDFNDIIDLLREYGLIPVGVCNATDEQQQSARLSGLGTLSGSPKPTASKPRANRNAETIRPMVINHPVRSGQQIYAKNTDLIIQASVSNGAEILADGHIHVYGTLRGRALAGVQGDTQARIYAMSLHAELVSIAGHYKLQDGIDDYALDGPVCVRLDEEQLTLEAMYGLANAQ